jgi:PAS domain S-box-containing protein
MRAGRHEIALIRTTAVSLEGLPVGVLIADDKGLVSYANPAVARMAGYQREDVVGKAVASFVHSDDKLRLIREFERSASGASSTYELHILHSSGRTLRTIITALPFTSEGRFDGTLAVVSDVTEVMETRAIADRYRQLSSFALDAVTHDLSNRMQLVVARAAMAGALLPEPEARARSAVAAAVQAAESASRLLKEVKLIAAAERARWPTRPMRLGALVEDAIALADLPAPAHVATEMAPGTSARTLEANELASVALAKLLEEAAEGSPKDGEARVECHAELIAGSPTRVLLRVVGARRHVSDDDLKVMLATPGQLAERDTPWRAGVKLPLAAAIAQAQGWELRAVRAAEGRGTVFEVTFTLSPSP